MTYYSTDQYNKLNYYALLTVILNPEVTPQRAIKALWEADGEPSKGCIRGYLPAEYMRDLGEKLRQQSEWREI